MHRTPFFITPNHLRDAAARDAATLRQRINASAPGRRNAQRAHVLQEIARFKASHPQVRSMRQAFAVADAAAQVVADRVEAQV